MSNRERWIIYPLLFLTFGAVMRDKLIIPPKLAAREVVCEKIHSDEMEVGRARCQDLSTVQTRASRLVIDDDEGNNRAVLDVGNGGSGRLELLDADGRPAVGAGTDGTGRGGMMAVFRDAKPRAEISSNAWGGEVTAISQDQRIKMGIAFDKYSFFAFAQSSFAAWHLPLPRALLLTLPVSKTPAAKPASKPPSPSGRGPG
jgi:hypothetical protein